jgi:hypothetical protein
VTYRTRPAIAPIAAPYDQLHDATSMPVLPPLDTRDRLAALECLDRLYAGDRSLS